LQKTLWWTCIAFSGVFFFCLIGAVWGPIGPLLVEPLVHRYGENIVPILRVAKVDGSLYSGLTLNGVELISGDTSLLSARRIMLRPSWKDLLQGALWLSDLEIDGVKAKVEDLSTLAAHYGGEKSEGSSSIRPIQVLLHDITFDTPFAAVGVEEGFLTQDGSIMLSADLGGLPVRLRGTLAFESLEALSIDVSVGTTGRAFFAGKLTAPFKVKGSLQSVKLNELLAVFSQVEGRGEIDGQIDVMGAGENLGAWGTLRLKDGQVAGFPVEASVPWRYKAGDFSVSQAKLESGAGDIELKVSADLRPNPVTDRFFARGSVRNASMKKLERLLSPGVSLEGEGGMVDFWTSADQGGAVAGKVFMRLPELKVEGKEVVKGLRANLVLSPNWNLAVDCTGEVFGGKVFGAGEVLRSASNALWHSTLKFTLKEMKSNLVATAFPALAPLDLSGTLDADAHIVSLGNDLAVRGEARSQAFTLFGRRFDALSASMRYEKGTVVLEDLKARIDKALLDFSGAADLTTSELRFAGNLKGFNPQSIPELSQVEGLCDVTLEVQGTLTSPRVMVTLISNENKVAGVPLRHVKLSGTYENNKVYLPETTLQVPGGSLSFRGDVDLSKNGEPYLNLSGALTNLDLESIAQDWDMDVTGKVEGTLKVSGAVSNAALSATLRSNAIMVASTDVRDLYLDVTGTTRNVRVRSVKAKINEGALEGNGNLTFGRRGRLQIGMKVKGIEIRSLLAQFGLDGGVGGYLDGFLSLRGSPLRPELALEVTSPLTIQETLVDHLMLTIISPARGKFDMDASGRLGDLALTLKGHMERNKEGWGYAAESSILDLDQLVSAKMPSLKGQFAGNVKARVTGRMNGRRNRGPAVANVMLTLPVFSVAGVELRDIFLPIRVSEGRASVREGTGVAYGGKIDINADVNMPDQQWKATAKISGLNIGQAAHPFMAQGAIVGSADVNVQLKGNYGPLMMVFANGDFRSSEGYIHEFDILKNITKDGRISFEEIRGSFFWDGNDLWLNPGTQATAKPGAPLYKYFSINGPLGLLGKDLALICKGRFDVQALNTVLGALKGVLQFMTGSLAGNGQLLRQAVSKLVGYSERDFQDVTFQLKGSWKELQLLNLTIDKSIEEYLPLRNDTTTQRKESERKIRFNLRIPTGPGGGDDDLDAQEQFKKQLLDNLLNQLDL
jgi:hypothetical protein